MTFLGSKVNSAGRAVAWDPASGELPDGDELAHALADRAGIEDIRPELSPVAQQVAMLRGQADLTRTLKQLLPRTAEPGRVHRCLARLPGQLRRLGRPPRFQLLVTVNYDTALEDAFRLETSHPTS